MFQLVIISGVELVAGGIVTWGCNTKDCKREDTNNKRNERIQLLGLQCLIFKCPFSATTTIPTCHLPRLLSSSVRQTQFLGVAVNVVPGEVLVACQDQLPSVDSDKASSQKETKEQVPEQKDGNRKT
ncbi:hypothetical protein E2C01_055766 [Portunus trituberculatus]|uniref:Uncharacterized protein n=1 Tax=Portunus trituberculatus TaxID=210409 RepID=A0A5B7GNL0_PORTR|nr:hypothetical protein [Portunus trituberculatus]